MTSTVLRLTLQEDVVLSERAATLGGHRGLDYIPGAALLGAAAHRLYAVLDRDEAWTAFHSGKVRFGDGLPVASYPSSNTGAVGLPIPSCWHTAKHAESAIDPEEICLKPEAVRNLQWKGTEWWREFDGPDQQPEQMRRGYIGPEWAVVEPERELRMRTAIDAAQGIRREAALFGYQAIRAGQEYLALLEADEEASDLLQRIADALTAHELRLGRSRQAEHGRVQCSVEPENLGDVLAPPPGWLVAKEGDAGGSWLVLWLLSDLAVEDEWGMPVLEPTLQQLYPDVCALLPREGIEQAIRPDLLGSFIRARRYSPYNGYLRCHDVERVVLARGSVLRYEIPSELAYDALWSAALRGAIGLHRECGFGRVWANPEPLNRATPEMFKTEIVPMTEPAVDQPHTYGQQLQAWLVARVDEEAATKSFEKTVADWLAELHASYRTAGELAVRPGEPIGPGPSQWGRVLELARRPGVASETMLRELFTADNAICGADSEDWGAQGLTGETFRDWLNAKVTTWVNEASGRLDPKPLSRSLAAIISAVAGEARGIAKNVRGGWQ